VSTGRSRRTHGRSPRILKTGIASDALGADPVLVVNAGSTSLKLSLVDRDESRRVESWHEVPGRIVGVGHRVVHGGPELVEPVVIDDDVIDAVRGLAAIAPLHNSPALEAIEHARHSFSHVPHVAVFDTAFHATIPPEAATYAIPRQWREDWGIRRYGFHGVSVQSAAERVRVPRLVVCHLGGGCSITAVREGRSVDTTMGFTPLEGVPMATRSGSVDPGALLHLLRERGLGADELDQALEHESGLVALGGTHDVRRLDGTLALDVYVHRIAGAVAAMAAAAGGLDALVFTAGVGEGSAHVRERVCERLGFLGIELDREANRAAVPDARIQAPSSRVAVHVLGAQEELVIARAVRGLVPG
jgi:acetate kinase